MSVHGKRSSKVANDPLSEELGPIEHTRRVRHVEHPSDTFRHPERSLTEMRELHGWVYLASMHIGGPWRSGFLSVLRHYIVLSRISLHPSSPG